MMNGAVSVVVLAIISTVIRVAMHEEPYCSSLAIEAPTFPEQYRQGIAAIALGDYVRCSSEPELGTGAVVAIGRKYGVNFKAAEKAIEVNEDELAYENGTVASREADRANYLWTSVIWISHPEVGAGQATSATRIITVKYESGTRIHETDLLLAD